MPELFPFQQVGVNFTVSTIKRTGAVLIADEMGLGKSAQAIEACRRLRATKVLVITRNGVKSTWKKEIQTWDPGAHLAIIPSGPKATPAVRKTIVGQYFKDLANGPGYLIVHYDALRLLVEDLRKHTWDVIIADECQDIKNRKALRTKALKVLQARYKMGLSGTPLVNRPDEIWSLLNWFFPTRKQANEYLGSPYYAGYWKFYEDFVRFSMHPYLGVRIIEGYKNLNILHDILGRFTIRRLKKDTLKDLPDKYYTTVPVELGSEQLRVYKQMEKEFIAWIGAQGDVPLTAPSVLAQLTRLRMFADAYAEVEVLQDSEGVPVDIKVHLTEPSSKVDALMDLVTDEDKSFVVFTQYRDMVSIIAERLRKAGISFVEFHGGVGEDERARALELFQNGQRQIFLGTPQAGGVGLTLTAADTVIFVDRSWSPATNLQAEDRLHRIGQKNAVQVIILEASDTIDEGVAYALRQKWDMIKRVLDGAA